MYLMDPGVQGFREEPLHLKKTQKTVISKLKLPTEERVSDLLHTYFIISLFLGLLVKLLPGGGA